MLKFRFHRHKLDRRSAHNNAHNILLNRASNAVPNTVSSTVPSAVPRAVPRAVPSTIANTLFAQLSNMIIFDMILFSTLLFSVLLFSALLFSTTLFTGLMMAQPVRAETSSEIRPALPEYWQEAASMDMNVLVYGQIEFVPRTSVSRLYDVTANLSLFPRTDYRQETYYLSTVPEGLITKNAIIFRQKPRDAAETFDYFLSAKVKGKGLYPDVEKKVPFPIPYLPEEIKQYTLPSGGIDSDNPEILNTAGKITSGATDLYTAVVNISNFVQKEVNYTLDTLTEEATQNASWVLRSRYGVCDEITVLFIALSRAAGIPARYVSGAAYTNANGINNWGLHAWAEIYYPGAGWIPFDITYNQFGYVDASHIKLKDSLGAFEPSVAYEWRGNGVDAEIKGIWVNASLLSISPAIRPRPDVTLHFMDTKAGIGSYNVVYAEITNLGNSYTTLRLQLIPTTGLIYYSPREQHILLESDQIKRVFWKIKVNSSLSDDFIYTFPIRLYAEQADYEGSFSSRRDYKSYSDKDAEFYIQSSSLKQSKSSFFYCSPEKESYYVYEKATVLCFSKSQVCDAEGGDGSCPRSQYGTNGQFYVFTKDNLPAGISSMGFSSAGLQDTVLIKILDEPKLELTNLSYTNSTFGRTTNVSFILHKTSLSNALNTYLYISISSRDLQKIDIGNVDYDMIEQLEIPSYVFGEGINEIRMTLVWKDSNGIEYRNELTHTADIGKLTLFQKIKRWLARIGLFRWLE